MFSVAVLLCAAKAHGQVDPASSVVDPEVGAAPSAAIVAPSMAFDVVSVRRVTIPSDRASIESRPDSDGIVIRNLALKWIIDFAYDFQRPDLVSGLPDWTSSETYDIVAKVSETDVPAFRKLGQEERRAMLQALLRDRFHLSVHTAALEVPVYALTIAKSGAKLTPSSPGDAYANGVRYPNGSPAGPGTLNPTPKGLVGQGADLRQLVMMLSKLQLGRQVVDRTGLAGRYDFVLQFSPTEAMRRVINGQMQALSAQDEMLPSVFTAVQEQLGLKLEPSRATVEGLVVDHIERPGEN